MHTKYSSTETDPRFEPNINLLCPERILIISNGFMHMLRIDVDTPAVSSSSSNCLPQQNYNLPCIQQTLLLPRTPQACEEDRFSVPFTGSEADSEHSVVARIIADFSDIETEHTQRTNQQHSINICNSNNEAFQQRSNSEQNSVSYEKIIFSSNCSSGGMAATNATLMETSLPVAIQNAVSSNESSQSRKRNQRIVTKSYRNGITTIDMQVRSRTISTMYLYY